MASDIAPEGLFRQEALDHLNAPEPLDELIEITPLRGWIAWLGLSLLMGSALAWATLGTLPVTVQGRGLLNTKHDVTISQSRLYAVLQVPLAGHPQIKPGMAAQISPAGAAPELYGFIEGKVSRVTTVATKPRLAQIEVNLTPDAQNVSGLHWTLKRSQSFPLTPGAPCRGTIILAERRPLALLFSQSG